MQTLTCQFLGTGDAFGTGGRAHSCFRIYTPSYSLLVDCGGTAPLAWQRVGQSLAQLDAVLITHLHGDHYGGLPFLLLEAQYVHRRQRPLLLVGPAGLQARLEALCALLYPGVRFEFPIEYRVYFTHEFLAVGPAAVRAYPVRHAPAADPHALRLVWEGRTLAFSGDTAWTDTLLEVAKGADLFICECYDYADRGQNGHLSLEVLRREHPRLGSERTLLTHLGPDMWAHREALFPFEVAPEGGQVIL